MHHRHLLVENETTVYHFVENTHITVIQLFRMFLILTFFIIVERNEIGAFPKHL